MVGNDNVIFEVKQTKVIVYFVECERLPYINSRLLNFQLIENGVSYLLLIRILNLLSFD